MPTKSSSSVRAWPALTPVQARRCAKRLDSYTGIRRNGRRPPRRHDGADAPGSRQPQSTRSAQDQYRLRRASAVSGTPDAGTLTQTALGSSPLNTNASENDIRACVTKRKISGGTISLKGRDARDNAGARQDVHEAQAVILSILGFSPRHAWHRNSAPRRTYPTRAILTPSNAPGNLPRLPVTPSNSLKLQSHVASKRDMKKAPPGGRPSPKLCLFRI